jgi:hypothetical protein
MKKKGVQKCSRASKSWGTVTNGLINESLGSKGENRENEAEETCREAIPENFQKRTKDNKAQT